MAPRPIRALAPLAIVFFVGCGGTTATPQAPGPTAGGGEAPTNQPATAAPVTPGPVPTQGGGGGGTASAACDLLTPEEAATSLGTEPLTTTGGEVAGQTYCDYRTASGEAVLTTYMQAAGAASLWGVYESSLTTEPVEGVGDKAMFEPSTKLLFVLKGDAFFNLFIADLELTPAQALEKGRPLALMMVGRL